MGAIITVSIITTIIYVAFSIDAIKDDKLILCLIVSFEAILGFVAGLIFGLAGSAIATENAETKISHTETVEIYALTDTTSAKGRNFLYSGYVNGKLVYRYVIETEKGKQVKELDSKNAYIIEDDTEQPRIEIHEKTYENDWLNKFFFIFSNKEYIIYIPEGSITTEYNIDLE